MHKEEKSSSVVQALLKHIFQIWEKIPITLSSDYGFSCRNDIKTKTIWNQLRQFSNHCGSSEWVLAAL